MANKIIEKSAPIRMYRTFTGIVTSTAMNKTITAKVEEMKLNEKYQKKFKVSKKYHVHDEKGEAKVGDTVNFVECRPLSKTKRWRLQSVVTKK
jgi:small subunit ribosomal protein S17